MNSVHGGTIMKKMIVMLVAFFAIYACSKQPQTPDNSYQLIFDINVTRADDTKAVKTDFVDGDKLYVFFEDVTGAKYVTLTKTDGVWGADISGSLTIEDLAESGKHMYAVYFPFGTPTITASGDGVSFGSALELMYTYYMTGSAKYTLTKAEGIATLSGTLDMFIPDNFVQFFIDKDGEGNYNANDQYRLAVDQVRPVACASYANGSFTQSTKDYSQPMWGYAYGTEGIAFSGEINSSEWSSAAHHRIILFDTTAPAKSKVFTKTLTSHQAINLKNAGSWSDAVTIPTKGECVTVNGIKWAPYNIGASANYSGSGVYEDYGFLFAWGELIPYTNEEDWGYTDWNMKNDMSLVNYYWYDGSSYLKYDSVGQALESVDDVATAFWGPNWRIPTAEEYRSSILIASGFSYDYSSFTYNNGSLWFPEIDTRNGTQSVRLKSGGSYQTSTLTTYSSNCPGSQDLFYFYYRGKEVSSWTETRHFGVCVRPIYIGE